MRAQVFASTLAAVVAVIAAAPAAKARNVTPSRPKASPTADAQDAPSAAENDPQARLKAMERRLALLEAELARRPLDISSYHLPQSVELCGQKIRLEDPDVRERMERELYLVLGDREQVVLWTKRARRVFPAIEAEVARTGACPDVRYLAVIESGLRPAVTSHANAHGYWQFMSPTAREYGLSVDGGLDERADLLASSRAGVKYLADLARGFDGDWALGMAAYNTGMGRLRNAMEAQGRRDFWRLDLIDEAERYVPRVLAAKIVMSDLRGYGFDLSVEDGYAAEDVERVVVRLSGGRGPTLLETARRLDLDYRMLRRLNPTLTDSTLPTGRAFSLVVPRGRGDAARALAARGAEAGGEVVERARAVARPEKRPEAREHLVQRGDSLGAIAARNKISVDELRRLNRLSRKEPIRQGQKLIVRR